MAALYCEDDGLAIFEEQKQADSGTSTGSDPGSGEFTKVVIGPLAVRSECRCNACNRPIRAGDTAVYVSHHSRLYPDNYGERGYLDMDRVRIHKV